MRIIPRDWPRDVPVPPPIPKRYFEDEKWLREHRNELAEQYPDQWVAVFHQRVVAAGKDLGEVRRAAHEQTGERDVVLDLVSPTRMFYSPQR